MTGPSDAARLDLARFIRPGDTVLIGQGCGEPGLLVDALIAQRAALGRVRVLLCTVLSERLRPAHADHLDFLATGISAGSRALAAAGHVDILPSHYSALEPLLRSGALRCDVVMLQLGPAGPDGRFSLGATHDYLVAALPRARAVLAEFNHHAPFTHGSCTLAREDIALLVESDAPLVAARPSQPGEAEQRIAEHVAALVPERATLQIGIGAVPDAVAHRLRDRRGLGFHAGMLSDAVAELIDCGAIDNAHRTLDRGLSVAGVLLGTERLFRFADRNPAIAMRSPGYTHDPRTLARIERLCSINSALEVDLSGQVNAEALRGRYVGAIGGQVDFIRGAQLSPGGRSIVALTSTHGSAAHSRIVARLAGPVTTARSDVDAIVTEWGVAELRGRSLRERARALVAIADPRHREALERAAHDELSSP